MSVEYTFKGHGVPTAYRIRYVENGKEYPLGYVNPDVPIRYLKTALEWILSGGGNMIPGDLGAARQLLNRFNDVADLLETERQRRAQMDPPGWEPADYDKELF